MLVFHRVIVAHKPKLTLVQQLATEMSEQVSILAGVQQLPDG